MPDDFLSHDAASIEYPDNTLKEAVKGDRKTQLEALRDYIARQLEANLCNTCLNSRLRTGDQASLILRLQTILEELETLRGGAGEVSTLDSLRLRVAGTVRHSDPPDIPLSGKAAQRRAGSRRVGRDGRSAP